MYTICTHIGIWFTLINIFQTQNVSGRLSLTSPSAGAPSGLDQSSCWRLQGRPAADSLKAKVQPHQVSPHINKNRWSQSHQPLTFPAIELCELCKAHVVANPHTHFTERCGRSYKVKTMLVQLRGKKTRVERRHLRVSNTDKLSPGLSVSDSWKQIFPGMSMSKRWIWKEETFKEGRETLLSS